MPALPVAQRPDDNWITRRRFIGEGPVTILVVGAFFTFPPRIAATVGENILLAGALLLMFAGRVAFALKGDRWMRLFRKPKGPPPLSLGGD